MAGVGGGGLDDDQSDAGLVVTRIRLAPEARRGLLALESELDADCTFPAPLLQVPGSGSGVGVEGASLIDIARRRMNLEIFVESLAEAARLTATVFSVVLRALALNQFVSIVGAPQEDLGFIDQLGLGPWGVVAIILVCFVTPGMIIHVPAMISFTVPILVPAIDGLALPNEPELKLVWWGIVMVVAVEISFVTRRSG